MRARLYRALGATHDERIVALVLIALGFLVPLLFAGAIEQMPVPQ